MVHLFERECLGQFSIHDGCGRSSTEHGIRPIRPIVFSSWMYRTFGERLPRRGRSPPHTAYASMGRSCSTIRIGSRCTLGLVRYLLASRLGRGRMAPRSRSLGAQLRPVFRIAAPLDILGGTGAVALTVDGGDAV